MTRGGRVKTSAEHGGNCTALVGSVYPHSCAIVVHLYACLLCPKCAGDPTMGVYRGTRGGGSGLSVLLCLSIGMCSRLFGLEFGCYAVLYRLRGATLDRCRGWRTFHLFL